MIATFVNPVEARKSSSRPVPSDAALLENLARASRELRVREAEGRRCDTVRAVIESLRKTLSWMAKQGSAIDPDSSDFWVERSSEGGIELWHGKQRVPVSAPHLEGAFESAGVGLEPGQRMIAAPVLVRRVVDESLLSYTLQECRLREAKAVLLRLTEEL